MRRSPLRKKEDLGAGAHDASTLTAIRLIRQANNGPVVLIVSGNYGVPL
jgi:hypothetical protein